MKEESDKGRSRLLKGAVAIGVVALAALFISLNFSERRPLIVSVTGRATDSSGVPQAIIVVSNKAPYLVVLPDSCVVEPKGAVACAVSTADIRVFPGQSVEFFVPMTNAASLSRIGVGYYTENRWNRLKISFSQIGQKFPVLRSMLAVRGDVEWTDWIDSARELEDSQIQ